MKINLYVEGGGRQNKVLQGQCRKGFRTLLEKAGLASKAFTVWECGSRYDAYDDFVRAHSNQSQNEVAVLLVDSESEVTLPGWQHLKRQDHWNKPPRATEDHVHMMVQCMETWLTADCEALQRFYGQGFKPAKLPTAKLEATSKQRIFKGLDDATKETKSKGRYDKSKHSYELLMRIDPAKIRQASPHAERFFQTITTLTQS